MEVLQTPAIPLRIRSYEGLQISPGLSYEPKTHETAEIRRFVPVVNPDALSPRTAEGVDDTGIVEAQQAMDEGLEVNSAPSPRLVGAIAESTRRSKIWSRIAVGTMALSAGLAVSPDLSNSKVPAPRFVQTAEAAGSAGGAIRKGTRINRPNLVILNNFSRSKTPLNKRMCYNNRALFQTPQDFCDAYKQNWPAWWRSEVKGKLIMIPKRATAGYVLNNRRLNATGMKPNTLREAYQRFKSRERRLQRMWANRSRGLYNPSNGMWVGVFFRIRSNNSYDEKDITRWLNTHRQRENWRRLILSRRTF